MTAAILEIRDGMATGPLHQPVKTHLGGKFNPAEPPLTWGALCGVRGYVYQRASLVALGHASECMACRVAAIPKKKRSIYNPGPSQRGVPRGMPLYTDEERIEARRLAWRSYGRRRKHPGGRVGGVCQDCGGRTSRAHYTRCRDCRIAANRAQHGTRSLYAKGCRCDLCREAQMAYQRDRRAA